MMRKVQAWMADQIVSFSARIQHTEGPWLKAVEVSSWDLV
jgi:hypothetical protein